MKPITAIPRFQFHLSHRHHYKGLITVGNEVIHCILDVDNFYNALGYTNAIRDTGLFFDEYIWHEYRKDNSNKPEACLQAIIIEYLIQNSATFIKKYADQYEDWLGRCNVITRIYDDCTQCISHPDQQENEKFNWTSSEVTFYVPNTI